jgi:hypothetical protein
MSDWSLTVFWKYFKYVIRHKWHVGKFLWNRGAYLQALTHDMSKFKWFAFKTYAWYFYGPDHTVEGNSETGYSKPTTTLDADFDMAWLLHQKSNPHHWQFWMLFEDDGGIKIIDMPDKYRIEMLCDWYGASIATGKSNMKNYRKNTRDWYLAHRDIMQLGWMTRRQLEEDLGVLYVTAEDHEEELSRGLHSQF